MDIVRASKISRKQVEIINDCLNTIDAINRHPVRRSITGECQAYGRNHIKCQYLARKKLCNKYKKKNHFTAICKDKFLQSAARNYNKTMNEV